MTFDYSGVGDGRNTDGTSEEGIVSFEAIVYAYDSQEMHCSFFDAPLAMTSGAHLAGPPPSTPYPIAIRPIDSSTFSAEPVVLMEANLGNLSESILLDTNARCKSGDEACLVLKFCIQLQVLVCQRFVDFVDVHVEIEFDELLEDCDSNCCLKVGAVQDTLSTTGEADSSGTKDVDDSGGATDSDSKAPGVEEGLTLTTSLATGKTTAQSWFANSMFLIILCSLHT